MTILLIILLILLLCGGGFRSYNAEKFGIEQLLYILLIVFLVLALTGNVIVFR